jgi:L-methionine (R)-S-oxide reductase
LQREGFNLFAKVLRENPHGFLSGAALSLVEDVSLPGRTPSMSEKTGLREDLRSEVEALVASDAPDEDVLNEVVRKVHEAHPSWDWSGIYLLVGDVLVLGPRTAPADHSLIGIGEGVCGTAISEDRNQIVEDVREVENYLACSIHTRSELVVLIRDAGKIVGEFDIDSDTVGAFTHEDEALLEEMGALISPRVTSLAASYESS